jgi:hypothetical protein
MLQGGDFTRGNVSTAQWSTSPDNVRRC